MTGQDIPENRNTNTKRINIEQAKNITFKADEKRVSMQKNHNLTHPKPANDCGLKNLGFQ